MIKRRWLFLRLAAGLLMTLGGCSVGNFALRHTANITDPPDVEVVRLPPTFVLGQSTMVAPSGGWVLASSTSASLIPNPNEASHFDLSPFLARDPFVGDWSADLPTEQRVFVRSSELARVQADPTDWRERYVVELAENHGPDIRRGTDENGRLTFDDTAQVLCPHGVSRAMISTSPADAIYETHFHKCPRFGADRVVITRELFGEWDAMRHSQAIYLFSYEVRGSQMTDAARLEGLELVKSADLQMATWNGDKHPIVRDARLRIVTRE